MLVVGAASLPEQDELNTSLILLGAFVLASKRGSKWLFAPPLW